MAHLTINDPPIFTEEIYQTEEEDYLTAELENMIKRALLNNDIFLKALIEEKEKERLYSKELKEVDLLTVQENGIYYVKQAQHTPDEENTEGYLKVINHPQKLEENRIIFWHPCVSGSGGYFNVLTKGIWLGWQQLASITDLKLLFTPKLTETTQNPENYKAGQIYSVKGTVKAESGHPYTADWTHFTYFVYGDENAENGYKNIIAIDYRGFVYQKSQNWNIWSNWKRMATLEDLSSKPDKRYTIYNKNVIRSEDLVGSAFTDKSWIGVGNNLDSAPTSGWINYLCLDAAATGSDCNQILAMEINGSNPHCYFTNDVKAKQWRRFLFIEDMKKMISNPNLLINPDFRINQRGQTRYQVTNRYSVDRWLGWNTIITPTENGIYITSAGKGQWELQQHLEFRKQDLLGKILTVSMMIEGLFYYKTFAPVPSSLTEEEVWNSDIVMVNDLHSRITIRENKLIFWVYDNASSPYQINWVKLEFGQIATPFIPPNVAKELILCKRYYQKLGTIQVAFFEEDEENVISSTYFILPMRTIPTGSISGVRFGNHVITLETSAKTCVEIDKLYFRLPSSAYTDNGGFYTLAGKVLKLEDVVLDAEIQVI